MPTFDTLMQLKVGGVTTIQVTDYSYRSDPIVKEGQGRTGTKLTISGEGYLEADTPANFSAAIGAAITVLSVSGADVVVYGLGGVAECSVLAAVCVDGGPHLAAELSSKPEAPLNRGVKFAVVGLTSGGGGGGTPTPLDAWKQQTQRRPDGLNQITRTGEVTGPGALAQFLTVILPAVAAQYPARQWVLSQRQWEQNLAGDKITYSIVVQELVVPLPSTGNTTAVDGERSQRVERDEQMRKVTVITYDLLINGDANALAAMLRPTGITILKESLEVSTFKEIRMRLEFQLLEGGNGNDLLDWQQSFEMETEFEPILDAFNYPGADPVYSRRPREGVRWVQSGRAVGAGKFVKPPTPFFLNFSGKTRVKFAPLNQVEMETTWSYPLIADQPFEMSAGFLAKLVRPAQPEFF